MAGKKEQARNYFLKYKRRKQSFYAFCNLTEINLSLEKYQDAGRTAGLCLNSASEDGIDEYERYYLLAVNNAVRTMYQDNLQLHPQTQLDLAIQYEQKGRFAEAIANALTALMLDPTNKDGLFRVGKLYSELGDYSKAASNLNAYISLAGPGGEFTYEAYKILFNQTMAQF
jgi:tetratricopeptide (TPR) repeat protein